MLVQSVHLLADPELQPQREQGQVTAGEEGVREGRREGGRDGGMEGGKKLAWRKRGEMKRQDNKG